MRAARGARPLDRRVQLILAAVLTLVAAAPAGATPPLLQEQVWLDPAADPAVVLTHTARECLAATSPRIEAGRALFASPTVLGGPAARVGLSCAACHAAGRSNAHFLLPELTDRPGAADVTSEWASKVRGDGRVNPVAIPDLAGASSRSAYGQARVPGLAAFIRGVVVEEFQGRDDPAIIGALTDYVAALGPPCGDGPAPLSLSAAFDDIDRALRAAGEIADPALIGATLRATRHLVGRVVERLPERRAFASSRSQLAQLAAEMATLEDARGSASSAATKAAIPGWRARLEALGRSLERRAGSTYFEPRIVRRALNSRK